MAELRFYEKKKRINYNTIRTLLIWLFDIVLVVIVAFFLVSFFGRRVTSINEAMAPTLESGDQILLNRVSYMIGSPKRDDIIVFKPNGNDKAHSYIRRVIGLPGETIQIKGGNIYINGEIYEDGADISDPGIAADEFTLGGDEYFVLGDNHVGSEDSRLADIGPVKRDHIEGRAWFIISPREKMGSL